MKTLYLHIGTPKTGTTAIQIFCEKNREVLEKQGYIFPEFDFQYPGVPKRRNAHFLVGKHDNEINPKEQEEV